MEVLATHKISASAMNIIRKIKNGSVPMYIMASKVRLEWKIYKPQISTSVMDIIRKRKYSVPMFVIIKKSLNG